ncbi:MAG: DUF6526 family protein [Bacteroidota bacterium]
MQTQNYANHKRYVFMFHGVLLFVLVITIIGSFVNFYESLGDHQRIYSASLISILGICTLMLLAFLRGFTTKLQNRVIRSEENMRHFVLTGKLLNPKLTMNQIVALRFASDEEYLPLVKRALDKNLSNDAIKRAVKNWRADNYRV